MPRSKIPHRYKALFVALGALALIFIGAAAAAVVLLSGAYSTAATTQHFAVTYRFLELGLRYSVASYADEIRAPDLENAVSVPVGQACFRTYCVQCHGAPGIARDPLGMGQLPSPSSLAQSARDWPAEHLFYVTQKGVRMSGMPAWEFRISEYGLWSTVAFLKTMPYLSSQQYDKLANENAGLECPQPREVPTYSAKRAEILLRQYACHNCHHIDGVVGPETYIGPSLEDWHRRKYIAGLLPNSRDNLVRWIRDPQAISPATLMPDMQVSEGDARAIARYLYGEQ
jgi:mono/diheme cytochrome c family protein/cytochrome c551/c552